MSNLAAMSMVENLSTSRTDRAILPFLIKKMADGHQVCLITIINKKSSAPRPVGSQVAVSSDAQSVGYVTGGCAENALVYEALQGMDKKSNFSIEVGDGVERADIRLPCGSVIMLHFEYHLTLEALQRVFDEVTLKRQVCEFHIDPDNSEHSHFILPSENETGRSNMYRPFVKKYVPPTRLCLFGKGPILPILADMAVMSGMDVSCWSPEKDTLAQIRNEMVEKEVLTTPQRVPVLALDRYMAGATLFHDHEWEPRILAQFLNSEAFYIGALGSRKTHSDRLELLTAMGFSSTQIDRVKAPIGLDIRAKEPVEIALASLAQIVATKNQNADAHGVL